MSAIPKVYVQNRRSVIQIFLPWTDHERRAIAPAICRKTRSQPQPAMAVSAGEISHNRPQPRGLHDAALRTPTFLLCTTGARRREYRDHRLEWMVKSGGIDIVLAGLRDNNIRFPWPPAS